MRKHFIQSKTVTKFVKFVARIVQGSSRTASTIQSLDGLDEWAKKDEKITFEIGWNSWKLLVIICMSAILSFILGHSLGWWRREIEAAAAFWLLRLREKRIAAFFRSELLSDQNYLHDKSQLNHSTHTHRIMRHNFCTRAIISRFIKIRLISFYLRHTSVLSYNLHFSRSQRERERKRNNFLRLNCYEKQLYHSCNSIQRKLLQFFLPVSSCSSDWEVYK